MVKISITTGIARKLKCVQSKNLVRPEQTVALMLLFILKCKILCLFTILILLCDKHSLLPPNFHL